MAKRGPQGGNEPPWELRCDQADMDNLAQLLYDLAVGADRCLYPRLAVEADNLCDPWSHVLVLEAAAMLSRRRRKEMTDTITRESYDEVRLVLPDEMLPEVPDVVTADSRGELVVDPASFYGLRHACRLAARWVLCGYGPVDALETMAGTLATVMRLPAGWLALKAAHRCWEKFKGEERDG